MSRQDFPKAQAAREHAERMRDMALVKVRDLCRTGQRHLAIPFLLANMERHSELTKLRLWKIDAIMFGTSRERALKLIRRMREFIKDDSNRADGMCNLAWAVESQDKSVRMAAWLYMLLLREHIVSPERPDDWPFGMLYDTSCEPDKEMK